MRRALVGLVAIVLVTLGLLAAGDLGYGPVVITREGEQKLILLLGDVRTVTSPGWTIRIPVLEEVQRYDRRWLHLSTEALPIQTAEGEQLNVDNYVIWRIDDPEAFWRAFQGKMENAVDRIDGVVRDDVRAVIGRHTLAEVLKDRRTEIMREITASSASTLTQFGVEVSDVRINRTELPAGAEGSVYARMRTERERLAKKSRAEGDEKARRIRARAEREARVIVAEGARDAEIAKGEGDARAAAIYASAYDNDREFYAFVRSLEAYRKAIDEDTTLVLSPRSEFFRFLESSSPLKVSEGASR